ILRHPLARCDHELATPILSFGPAAGRRTGTSQDAVVCSRYFALSRSNARVMSKCGVSKLAFTFVTATLDIHPLARSNRFHPRFGSSSCAYERHLFCKRCDVPQARDPVVDQTCNEGNCADEDCDGEKAAYVAALKKRIHLLLRLIPSR